MKIKKYIKIENDQITEISLEPAAGFIEFDCQDSSLSVYLVNGQLVESRWDPNKYTSEQIALYELVEEQDKARQYLASTDWYAVRKAETGKAIPAEVLERRQLARQLLSS